MVAEAAVYRGGGYYTKEENIMSRRGENIYKRKDGRYEGRYVIERFSDGKCKFGYVYGRRYQECREMLIIQRSLVYRAEDAGMPRRRPTMADWMSYWLYHEVKPYVRMSTFQNYSNHVDNYFMPKFGLWQLDSIKRDEIQTYADELAQSLASSTVCNIFGTLRSCLRAAYVKGLIAENPYYKIRLPRKTFRRPRVLTKAEQQVLETKFMENGQLEYLLCLYMGLRVGEVCALKYEDIDLKKGELHVRHTIQRVSTGYSRDKTEVIVTKPKTERSVRDLPIPNMLLGLLAERMETQDDPEGYMFSGGKGRPIEKRTMQNRFAAVCAEAGLEGVHMHTLRHTFATRCLEQKIGIEVLSELLGHSSPRITMECYAHCTEETKRRYMEFMGPIGDAVEDGDA